MTFEEACAYVAGTNNFDWLHVRYDFDSGAWVSITGQTGTTHTLEAGDRPAAQDEALSFYGKTAASGWVYAGGDEDGSKVVIV